MSSKPKRLVLFGAGASNGSGSISPEAPPLGGNLYAELRRVLPSWNNLPANVTIAFNKSFEDGMQVLWENYSTHVPELMRRMAVYFAQFRIKGSDNLYQRFVKDISTDFSSTNYLLGSLNYDILLEIAIRCLGLEIYYFGTDAPKGAASVWKLHGSCNFLPDGIGADRRTASYGSGARIGAAIKPVWSNEAISFCLSQTALYPIMALYMKSKPVQIGNGQMRIYQELWINHVLEADKILIVGVKPWPDDEHIWKPLTETKANIGYIGGKEEYDKWLKTKSHAEKTEFISDRWDQGFKDSIDFIRR